jgi:hypothetical protein
MEADQIVNLGLEGSLSLMLVVLAYKLYKMKIKSHSGCCLDKGNGIVLETQNSGVSAENDVLNKL